MIINLHGTQLFFYYYYHFHNSTSCLSVGLQGVKEEDVDKVQETIKSVISQVRETGFDSKRIEAAIHQMELGQKHVS